MGGDQRPPKRPDPKHTAYLFELLLKCPVPVVLRWHLGCHVTGMGQARSQALGAAQHPGAAVSTESLSGRGLAGEQAHGAQVGRLRGTQAFLLLLLLFLKVVFIFLFVLLFLLPQFFQLLLLPLGLPGMDTGYPLVRREPVAGTGPPVPPPPASPSVDQMSSHKASRGTSGSLPSSYLAPEQAPMAPPKHLLKGSCPRAFARGVPSARQRCEQFSHHSSVTLYPTLSRLPRDTLASCSW